jgi:subtilisin family serine protease
MKRKIHALRRIPRGRIRILFLVAVAVGLAIFLAVQISLHNLPGKPAAALSLEALPSNDFYANQILIKVKEPAHQKLGAHPLAQATGIASLDNKNKALKVTAFKQLGRAGKASKQSHSFFRWYVVNLPGSSTIVQGSKIKKDEKSKDIPKLTPEAQATLSALEQYRSDPSVEEAQLNFVVHTSNVPNDPYYGSSGSWAQAYDDLWGLKKINAATAWNYSTGSKSVVVADIDTGLDRTHPDIANNVWTNQGEMGTTKAGDSCWTGTPQNKSTNNCDDDSNGYVDDVYGWNWVADNNNPSDDNGHGTHTAGTIGAVGNNGTGVVGVNWQASIMGLKFMNSSGSGSGLDAASAIQYAADMGAKVTSNSWGCDCEPGPEADAISYAYSKGVITVAAAGNSNEDARISSPASIPDVITVAASDPNDLKASFSNFGPKIDVAAPGVDILSLKSSTASKVCVGTQIVATNYCHISGTSMATPHVAGLAALLLAKDPSLSPEEVRQIIHQTADKVYGQAWETNFGYGRINAGTAMGLSYIPPVAKIYSPSGYVTSSATSISVTGLVSDRVGVASWQLSYGVGTNPATFQAIGQGTGAANGTLGSWDTSTFSMYGDYVLKLTVTNSAGKTSEDRMGVNIDRSILPGWPQTGPRLGSGWGTSAAIADIDGDGKLEIIAVSLRGFSPTRLQVDAWHMDGSEILGWPKTIVDYTGVYNYPTDLWLWLGGLTIADINGDGKKEIIFPMSFTLENHTTTQGTYDHTLPADNYLYVLNSDGTNYSGWPKVLTNEQGFYRPNEPAISGASLEGAGKQDLVYFSSKGILNAFKSDGTVLPGWPQTIGGTGSSSAVLADVNNDGKAEVFAGSSDSKVYGFKADGTNLTGWPQVINGGEIRTSPVIGDIDGDGAPEIVAGASGYIAGGTAPASGIYAWHANGTKLSGWPVNNNINYNGLILADLDGDHKLDVIYDGDTCCNIYSVKYTGASMPGWPVSFAWGPPVGMSTFSAIDLEADGKAEIGAQRNQGTVVLNSSGQTIWQRLYPPNTSSMSPLIADFDGDGKSEILNNSITSSGTNESSYYKLYLSNTGITNASADIIPWPMYQQNPAHTGALTAATAVPISRLSLSATLTTVSQNGSTTLNWSSNATSCMASGGWSGAKSASGSQVVSNLTATQSYVLVCSGGPGGTVTQSVTVNVNAPTPPPSPSPTPTPPPANPLGDLNGDGHVNIFDLSMLLAYYNKNNGVGDLNNDGLTDIFDLSIMLINYGL